MKKKTFIEFLDEANKKHNDKYEYDSTTYINTYTKMRILCPKHGEFWQTPKSHLKYGCQACAREYTGLINRSDKETFIKKAKLKHNNRYDYSKVEYINSETPVTIICPEHGIFEQTPTKHLNTNGCPICSKNALGKSRRYDNETVKNKIIEKYGDAYDVSNINYVNSRTLLSVVCKKHGEFKKMPNVLLNICGCPSCMEEEKKLKKENKINTQRKNEEEKKLKKENERVTNGKVFIETSVKKHNNKYDYSKVNYINSTTKVCIICPEHGEFWQTPHNHVNGCGCQKCASESTKKRLTYTKETFIENARKVHGNKYDYSKVQYVNNNTKVCIVCPDHGEFWQTPAMHYNEKQGCPNCSTLSSHGETEIYDFIKTLLPNETIIQREHTLIKGKEIDIYIPSKKIAIEYDGLRWHSEEFGKDKYYHLSKTEECNRIGVRLIHIFEDEFENNKTIVFEKLRQLLNCSAKEKIYARKCVIKEVSFKDCYDFIDRNHIQGSIRSSRYIAAYYNGNIVGAMTFLKLKDGYDLNRFCTDINYNVIGVGGKLLSFFIKNYDPKMITTFADRRWTINEENLYTKIGFTKEKYTQPNYSYVTSKNSYRIRYHKFNFRKRTLNRKYGLPLTMSENEMVKELGYYKIWDCGLIKYIWKRNG